MKLILIISAGRSGTNFFCDFFGKAFKNVSSNYELFGYKSNTGNFSYLSVQTLFFLAKEFGFDIDAEYDTLSKNVSDELNKLSKIEMVKKICEIPGFDFVSFKVFFHQVTKYELDHLIKMADFCIFMDRNPVHRYISEIRSVISGGWTNYDYSNLKINFMTDKYLFNKKQINSFIELAHTISTNINKKHLKINYETFCELDTQEKCDFLYYKIFQKNFWNIKMIQESPTNIDLNFKKQNNQTDLSLIIENYDEVKEFIDLEIQEYESQLLI